MGDRVFYFSFQQKDKKVRKTKKPYPKKNREKWKENPTAKLL